MLCRASADPRMGRWMAAKRVLAYTLNYGVQIGGVAMDNGDTIQIEAYTDADWAVLHGWG